MNPEAVDNEIERQLTVLDESTDIYIAAIRNASKADAAWKAAYWRAYLKAEGPAHLRDAEAGSQTAGLYEDKRISEGGAAAMKEALASTRARLDALRTLAANQRV